MPVCKKMCVILCNGRIATILSTWLHKINSFSFILTGNQIGLLIRNIWAFHISVLKEQKEIRGFVRPVRNVYISRWGAMHFKETFAEHQGSGLAPGVKYPNTRLKWQFSDELGWEWSPGQQKIASFSQRLINPLYLCLIQPVIDKSTLFIASHCRKFCLKGTPCVCFCRTVVKSTASSRTRCFAG